MNAESRVAETGARTVRLALAPLTVGHAGALFPLLDDWMVVRMLAQVAWPLTRADVEAYASRQRTPGAECIDFAILLDGAPIGVCGVKKPGTGHPPRPMPRLGYWIGRRHWGRGYATEAVAALADYAFQAFADDTIGAGVFDDNPGSHRVLAKLGFTEAGCYETHSRSRGGPVPTVDMQLARARWATWARWR
jgi:RimJ/RimL family protein N-acetyltransferase